MSGLAILTGLGQGAMQGSQFMLNARQQEEQARRQQAQLSMLQERHAWQKQDREREAQEQERVQAWQNLSMSVDTNYRDRDPLDRNAMKLDLGMKAGIIQPSEFQALMAQRNQLEQEGLLTDIAMGNTRALEQKFGARLGQPVTIRQTRRPDGRMLFQVTGANGQVMSELDEEQIGMLLGVDRLVQMGKVGREREKHAADLHKTDSEIERNKASAAASHASAKKYQTEARGQELENEGLAALPPADRGRTRQKGADDWMSTGAKEQEMYRRMSPEQQKAYRARRVAELTTELLKTNNTSYIGPNGRAKARADAEAEADTILGATPAPGAGPAEDADPLGLFK